MTDHQNEIQNLAQRYGRCGLIPFVSSALLVWVLPEETGLIVSSFFLFYSAVIFSFLSASFWYAGLQSLGESNCEGGRHNPYRKFLTISMAFSLLAWFSLLSPLIWGLVILGAGFIVIRQFERKYLSSIFPEWFAQMRDFLTRIVFASHLSVLVFVVQI